MGARGGVVAMLVAVSCAKAPGPVLRTDAGAKVGDVVSVVLGPEGGTVVSADGWLTVSVEKGLLADRTTISVQAIENLAPGAFGRAYRLLPAELSFARPITLGFYPGVPGWNASDFSLGVARQAVDGAWRWVPDFTLEGTRPLTVATSRLGDFALVQPMLVLPRDAAAELGARVPLQVTRCFPADTEDEPEPQGLDCEGRAGGPLPLVDAADVVEWTPRPGDPDFGRILGAGAQVEFEVPTLSVLARLPVTVTASRSAQHRVRARTEIVVGDGRPYAGTLDFRHRDAEREVLGRIGGPWRLRQLRPGSQLYAYEGGFGALSTAGCAVVQQLLEAHATLQVFASDAGVNASRHAVSLTATGDVFARCDGGLVQVPVSLTLSTEGCGGPPVAADPDTLSGSYSCDAGAETDLTWSFTRP